MGLYIFYLFLVGIVYYILNLFSIAIIGTCGRDRDLVWLKLFGIILYYINRVGCFCLALYLAYESLDLLLRAH